MHAGMSLQGAERDVMNMFISSMMFIVLGDDTVFNKARAGAKTYATEAKDKQEYDYEGDMAMSQLKSIIANSQRMHDMLSDDTNLPEWVQSKITLAEDYISTASNYMQGEMNEEVEELDELSTEKLLAYRKKAREADTNKHHVYADEADKKIKKKTGVYNPGLLQRAKAKLRNEEKMPFEGPYRKVGERKDKYGNTVKNVPKFLAKKAMNAQTQKNEEVESIDELSKATMGRYIKKAATKIGTQGVTAGLKIAKDERSQKNFDTIGKRERGISTAVKKITKEEVESIDELSKATMGSYVKKASGAERPKNVMDPKNVPLTKIAAYQGDSETGHFGKRFNQATYDKAERLRKNRETGIKTAVNKLTKEDIEQVDEISKKTMGRYINKAKDSIDMTSYRSGIKDGTAISSSTPYKSNNPLEKKLSKRHKGIETAVKKLTKEDIDAVKQMNESYKTAFETALNEYGIKSPSELDESKRKEFFNHVDLEFKKGDN
jgi:hypothetical protein